MPSKFHNVRTQTGDGITHDSAKEARRWVILKMFEDAGSVKDLQRQVRYDLHVAGGAKLWAYVADFVYLDSDGVTVVEDVKSAPTRKLPVYRAKKKHMLLEYGVDIREV
jgi:hypothetical protein